MIILNRYKGDHFEKPDCRCEQCGQVGTVYMFRKFHNIMPSMETVMICSGCISKAQEEMRQAILEDARLNAQQTGDQTP